MPAASKPSSVPNWATTAGRTVAPPSGKVAVGFIAGEEIPDTFLNWILHALCAWIAYLGDFELNAHTWTANQIFTSDGTVTFNGEAFFFGYVASQEPIVAPGCAVARGYFNTDASGNPSELSAGSFGVDSVTKSGSALKVILSKPLGEPQFNVLVNSANGSVPEAAAPVGKEANVSAHALFYIVAGSDANNHSIDFVVYGMPYSP